METAASTRNLLYDSGTHGIGKLDPKMRQHDVDGVGVVGLVGDDAPRSRTLRGLSSFLSAKVLASLDRVAAALPPRAHRTQVIDRVTAMREFSALFAEAATAAEVELVNLRGGGKPKKMSKAQQKAAEEEAAKLKVELERKAKAAAEAKVAPAIRLVALARRRAWQLAPRNSLAPWDTPVEQEAARLNRVASLAPQTTPSELWDTIRRRTDAIYLAVEPLEPAFHALVHEILTRVGSDGGGGGGTVTEAGAPLKDPVRMHEKAFDDYLLTFDDFETALPEACVRDVMRSRLVCSTAERMLTVVRILTDSSTVPLSATVGGQTARLTLVRIKNSFMPQFAMPNAFRLRDLAFSLRVEIGGRWAFAELQVVHEATLAWHESSNASAHYEYLRGLMHGGWYAKLLPRRVGRVATFVIDEVRDDYELMSLLLVSLNEAADYEGSPDGHDAMLMPFPLNRWELVNAATWMRIMGAMSATKIRPMVLAISEIAYQNVKADPPRTAFTFAEAQTAIISMCPESRMVWNEMLEKPGELPLIKAVSVGSNFEDVTLMFQRPEYQIAGTVYRAISAPTNIDDHLGWSDNITAARMINRTSSLPLSQIGSGPFGESLVAVRGADSKLQDLDFRPAGARLTADGVATLAWLLRYNREILSIHLGGNEIGVEGVKHVARGLLRNETIERLYLSSNSLCGHTLDGGGSFNPEGMLQLLASLPNTSITELDVSNNLLCGVDPYLRGEYDGQVSQRACPCHPSRDALAYSTLEAAASPAPPNPRACSPVHSCRFWRSLARRCTAVRCPTCAFAVVASRREAFRALPRASRI